METLLRRRREDIAGIIVSPGIRRPPRALPQAAVNGFQLFGFRGLISYGLLQSRRFASEGLRRALRLPSPYSTKAIAARYGVPCFPCRNVNEPEFLEFLARELAPDVIVSAFNPQIFQREVLALPTLGCINYHPSLLPRYRGVAPTFWALAHGEIETGVTVHYMDEKIDHGPIILQSRIPIHPEDTPHSLTVRTLGPGAALLLQALDLIEAGTVSTMPNDGSESSYHSFPTIEDVRLLRARGRKFF